MQKSGEFSNQRAEQTHVLFLIDSLWGSGGGAARALLRMIKLLPQDRFRCSVVTFRRDSELVMEPFPCPVHLLPLRRTYDWNAIRMALKLRRLIRDGNVRIVHTFFETADLWGGLVAKLSGCPVVISSRRDLGILRSPKHHFAYQMMGRLYDQVQVVSEGVRQYHIAEDRLDPKKVACIYNGIDVQQITNVSSGEQQRKELGLDKASHLIAALGTLRQVKGVDVLVRSAAIVCREFPRAAFLVIGEPSPDQVSFYQYLQDLTRSLRLTENVRFLGPMRDPIPLLKTCDIFCLPSRSEGFSNALIEAMACELPCIATAVGGNPEALQDGRNGFLVPTDDPEAIAKRILHLLRNPHHARQVGQAARRTVEEKFSADAMGSRLMELYEGLLQGSKGSTRTGYRRANAGPCRVTNVAGSCF